MTGVNIASRSHRRMRHSAPSFAPGNLPERSNARMDDSGKRK
jgi:hypothetical protein